jgi:hypothetical protein
MEITEARLIADMGFTRIAYSTSERHSHPSGIAIKDIAV